MLIFLVFIHGLIFILNFLAIFVRYVLNFNNLLENQRYNFIESLNGGRGIHYESLQITRKNIFIFFYSLFVMIICLYFSH